MPDEEFLDSICAAVARLLREERERQRLSLNSLSAQAGVARQTVTFIEHRDRIPTLMTLLRITSVLGIDLETLLTEARKAAERESKGPSSKTGRKKAL